MIDSFSGEYRFLSNFYPASVWFDWKEYPTVEHAYQAAKTLNHEMREVIRNLSTPAKAKYVGRREPLRPDWEQMKLWLMEELVLMKFEDPVLRSLLKATGDQELVEGNHWGDRFWGVCVGVGENHLGKILMKVRDGTN